jgi:hypothetical protein
MNTHSQLTMKPAVARVAPAKTASRAPFGRLQRKCACDGSGASSGSGGECPDCKKKKTLQRSATNSNQPGTAPPIVHDVLRSPGQPLDSATRAFMEPRFGHDFSKVRVHAGGGAEESARSVNALAYTVGRHLVFGAGQYSPSTPAGQRLIAHELAHVVQQGTIEPGPRQAINVGPPGDEFERNADEAASTIHSPQVARSPGRWKAAPDSGNKLRRAVTIPQDSVDFKAAKQPHNDLNNPGIGLVFAVTDKPIRFEGTAKAECGQGGNASGFELGIVQIETSETNQMVYEGATPADGAIQVFRDAPPIRPAGPCTDSLTGQFWIKSAPLACGQVASLAREDTPGMVKFKTIENNTCSKKPNYLKSLKVYFHFLTALMVKEPSGSLQALRWMKWHESWDYTFNTQPNGQTTAGGQGANQNVESTQSGSPPPELPTRYAVPAKTCNDLAQDAETNQKMNSYCGKT